jgi:hypothetical protein
MPSDDSHLHDRQGISSEKHCSFRREQHRLRRLGAARRAVSMIRVVSIAGVAVLGAGLVSGCSGQRSARHFRPIEYFESRTVRDDTGQLLAREEGVVDPNRGDIVVRSFDSDGRLRTESVVIGSLVLSRAGRTGVWFAARSRDFAPLRSVMSRPDHALPRTSTTLLDRSVTPVIWQLTHFDRVSESRIQASRLVGTVRDFVRIRSRLLGRVPASSRLQGVVRLRRWWSSGELVVDELRVLLAPSSRGGDTVPVTRSTVYSSLGPPVSDVTTYAADLGWSEFDDSSSLTGAEFQAAKLFGLSTAQGSGLTRQSSGKHAAGTATRTLAGLSPGLPNTAAPVADRVASMNAWAYGRSFEIPPVEPDAPPVPTPEPAPAPTPEPDVVVGESSMLPAVGAVVYVALIAIAWQEFGQTIAKKAYEAASALDRLFQNGSESPSTQVAKPPKPSFPHKPTIKPKVKAPVPAPANCLEQWEIADLMDNWSLELHHIATIEDKTWTPRYKKFFIDYYPNSHVSLNGAWNLIWVFHEGPHAWEYKQWIFDNLEEIYRRVGSNWERFLEEWEKVRQVIERDPSILNEWYWGC